MALQTLTPEGHMEWDCSHCGTRNGVHMSHEQVVIHHRAGVPLSHRMVGLPPCETCGASTHLKVHFTPAELEAPNFYSRVKDEEGNVVSQQRSASYDVALRHMSLIGQLDNLGKVPIDQQVQQAQQEGNVA